MIEFSANNFVKTLISIITGSPTSILFIVLGVIFTIAMIINVKKNKTIGKSLFIIGWIFIILFVIIKYNGYLSKLFDNLINTVFRQIFFPNLATYIIIIIITNIIFLYTVLNKKTKTLSKIINSIFFSTIMVLLVYTLDLIIKNKINVYEQDQLYTNEQVLTIIEASTIVFGLWILIIISKFLIKKLINKSNEKILKEFKNEKNTSELTPAVEPTPIIVKPLEPTTNTKQAIPIQNINPAPVIKQAEPIQNIEPAPVIKQAEPVQNIEPAPVIKQAEPVQNINPAPVIKQTEPVQNINPAPVIKQTEPVQNINPAPVIKQVEPVQNINPAPVIKQTEPVQNIEPAPVIKQAEPVQNIEPAPVIKQAEPVQNIEPAPVIKQAEPVQNIEPAPVIKQAEPVQNIEPAPVIQNKQTIITNTSVNNDKQINNPNIFNQIPNSTPQTQSSQNNEEIETLNIK